MGSKKQFCKNGHDTFIVGRDISRDCKICAKERSRRARVTNKKKINANYRKWYAANKEKVLETQRNYFAVPANKEKRKEKRREWLRNNKEKCEETRRNYRMFGIDSNKLPQELIDIGVLYRQLKKEVLTYVKVA